MEFDGTFTHTYISFLHLALKGNNTKRIVWDNNSDFIAPKITEFVVSAAPTIKRLSVIVGGPRPIHAWVDVVARSIFDHYWRAIIVFLSSHYRLHMIRQLVTIAFASLISPFDAQV